MKRLNFLAVFLLAVGLFSCGSSTAPEKKATIDDAWSTFENGDYAKALDEFTQLGTNEAAVGIGWSAVFLDSLSFAKQTFVSIAADQNIDANAGWALTLWALGDYTNCINKANSVLSKDANYKFSHYQSFSATDLIWLQAASYYNLPNYSKCIEKIKLLDSSFSASTSDPDIAKILLEKLDALDSL